MKYIFSILDHRFMRCILRGEQNFDFWHQSSAESDSNLEYSCRNTYQVQITNRDANTTEEHVLTAEELADFASLATRCWIPAHATSLCVYIGLSGSKVHKPLKWCNVDLWPVETTAVIEAAESAHEEGSVIQIIFTMNELRLAIFIDGPRPLELHKDFSTATASPEEAAQQAIKKAYRNNTAITKISLQRKNDHEYEGLTDQSKWPYPDDILSDTFEFYLSGSSRKYLKVYLSLEEVHDADGSADEAATTTTSVKLSNTIEAVRLDLQTTIKHATGKNHKKNQKKRQKNKKPAKNRYAPDLSIRNQKRYGPDDEYDDDAAAGHTINV
jgi:hypothetical protein